MADVMLLLVDREAFDRLCSMPLEQLLDGMQGQALRDSRPEADPRFHRGFDADLEGDVLEWSDETEGAEPAVSLSEQPIDSESACGLALALARWCSIGEWRCWEARLYLYIEPLLDRSLSAEEFLRPEVWAEFSEALANTDRVSYSESVVLDWMSRRQELGETMEPSEDPRILPTMEAHRSASESLHTFLDRARLEGLSLLIGREYLEPGRWNLDSESLHSALGATA